MKIVAPINEGSAFYVNVDFRDRLGALAQPVRAWWRAQDAQTGAVLVAETELSSLASQMQIVVPAATSLIPAGRDSLTVLITLVAQYGQVTDRVTELVQVPVRPVPGVPVSG